MQNIRILSVVCMFFVSILVCSTAQGMKREFKNTIDSALLLVIEEVIKKDPQLLDIQPRITVRAVKAIVVEETINGTKPYQCHVDDCIYSTHNKLYFKAHVQNHIIIKHDPKARMDVCTDCGFLTPAKRSFQDHLRNTGHKF